MMVRARFIGSVLFCLSLVLATTVGFAAPVKIGFWGYVGGDAASIERMERVIDAFQEKFPNIEVEHTPLQLHEIKAKIVPAYLGDSEPDVWFLDRADVAPMAARGLLMPLDKYLQADPEFNADSFFPKTLDSVTYNGQIYGIPNMLEIWTLYRNKQLMSESGLNPEAPPITFDEMIDYAKKLTTFSRDGALTRAGYVHLWANFGTYGLLRQFGGQFFSEDGRSAMLSSDAAEDALTLYRDFADEVYGGYDVLDGVWSNWGQGGPFVNNQVGFYGDWHWAEARWDEEHLTQDLEYGVSALPAPSGRDPLNVAGGWAYVMSSNSANSDAAWEFIKFSMGEEGQSILAGSATGKEYLVISGNRNYELSHFEEKAAKFPNFSLALNEASENLTYREPHPVFSDANGFFNAATQSVLRHEKAPQAALDEAQRQVQAVLDEYWQQQSN